MDKPAFENWLRRVRGLQTDTAASYAGRAAACETYFGIDLDLAGQRGQIPELVERTMARADLALNTRHDYATALRAYDEFCRAFAAVER
jgi:hypothetical protein